MFDSIEDAIAAIRNGELIIVVDDEDRENEGDFIGAAELITPEKINFMATLGRGLICAPIEQRRANELGLEMMVNRNTAMHETAFTVSIDLVGYGCTTGISSYDRATGIKAITDPSITKDDYAKPGHIFPLIAKEGGVLRRTGHTEAAVDLAKLAGLYPAGVLVEILNPDGTMARLPELLEMAKVHNMKIISIEDLVAYRLRTENLVERIYESDIESPYGKVKAIVYSSENGNDQHLAIKWGEWSEDDIVPVRVFSEHSAQELSAFMFSDWNSQMARIFERFESEGKGLILFMRQSERAISLLDSIKQLTHDLKPDARNEQRDLGIGAQILRDQQITKINLLTASNKRRVGILGYGLEIIDTTIL